MGNFLILPVTTGEDIRSAGEISPTVCHVKKWPDWHSP